MKILMVGAGGREHALIWKLKQSPSVEKIWCAPGNGGIAADAECVPIDSGDAAALAVFAEEKHVDLTVVGPELPLVNGIADIFAHKNLPLIGPSRQAAQLEGSKIFSKEFLLRHNIPTAEMYGAYDSPGAAYGALCSVNFPVVVKADGLCGGKGVFLAEDPDAATDFIERVMEKRELGPEPQKILLEETLQGDELSFIILTDGEKYAELVATRDHKRAFDGNQGPNTGGMGAYSSDDLLPAAVRETIVSQIVDPTLHGLAADGIRYQGFLYIGVMLTRSGPKVLEFNCRLGDPETQAIVARMDFDLADVLVDVANRRFEPARLSWKPGASACIVLASGGYPGKVVAGKPIHGLKQAAEIATVQVFHAGTKLLGDEIVTSGGRVLGVTAPGRTLEESLASAYRAASRIHFEGMQYRRDIGSANRIRTAGN